MLGLLALIPGAGVAASAAGAVFNFILSCRICLIALGLVAVFVAGELRGYQRASRSCKAAEHIAQAAAAQREAAAATAAAEIAAQAVQELSTQNADLEQKAHDYEAYIKTIKPATVQCRAATADDARRMRNIGQ